MPVWLSAFLPSSKNYEEVQEILDLFYASESSDILVTTKLTFGDQQSSSSA